jgi:16S rRNA (guanine966-N2)-methyltransferase
MRIISGIKRGMKLLGPDTHETRPITDRAKEALFSVLYKYDVIEDGSVADLFSGTGSMGLESLSRGAKFATFIEQSPKVFSILKKNIERADFVDQSAVLRSNVFKVGAPITADITKYTLVFVDPPYVMSTNSREGSQVANLMMLLNDQMSEGGLAIVRTHKQSELEESYGILNLIDKREWGTMGVAIYQLQSDTAVSDHSDNITDNQSEDLTDDQ